ncbi:uncharacterized protein LOC133180844 [Saccostrea echinata]|uniref:uncharacterized protein LOC133180844 n=1 Tax=Saccostrea echinata TaxID=191078 RepID=UPI002A839CFA|nr:uncharacterized protein LOC133180844 [Saccostrea echinata]
MDDDDVPPLEDMSEILQQAEVIRSKVNSSQGKQSVDPSPRGAVPQKDQDNKKPLEKSSDNQKGKTTEKSVKNAPSKSSSASFGGFKKGFLFGGNSSSKATSSSSSGSSAKSSSDLPFITKKSTSDSRELPEVQKTLTEEAQKIAQNKDEWLTADLMKKIEANDALFKKLGDPKYVEAVNQFQTDPVRAMEQYKDNKEIQDFLTSFCKVMGEHFTGLADKQDKAAKPSKPAPPSKIVELNSDSEVSRAKSTPSHTINPNRSETLYTRSPSEGADLSVRSSTNPNQPTSEDERRMQEILANPEIRNILMDPKIMNLIETLKFNPDEGARILQNSDLELRQKINKLVQCGLLQFQG